MSIITPSGRPVSIGGLEIIKVCPFCEIVMGKLPAFLVLQDEHSLAFLDRRPLFPGHCLLIPKRHFNTLVDLPPDLVASLFQNAQRVARALETGLGAKRRLPTGACHLLIAGDLDRGDVSA